MLQYLPWSTYPGAPALECENSDVAETFSSVVSAFVVLRCETVPDVELPFYPTFYTVSNTDTTGALHKALCPQSSPELVQLVQERLHFSRHTHVHKVDWSMLELYVGLCALGRA